VEGKSVDSSGKKRWARAEESFENIQQFPLGRGWAAAGWVHNDFLMITENLGVAGGLCFIVAYGITLFRLLKTARARAPSPQHRDISISLLLAVFVAGWLLAFDATLVLTQLALPVWTAWVLGETWVHQNQTYTVASHG
jgi:O-antigen ligase